MFSVNILLLWIWMCSYIGDGAPGKYYMVKLKEDEQLTDKKYDHATETDTYDDDTDDANEVNVEKPGTKGTDYAASENDHQHDAISLWIKNKEKEMEEKEEKKKKLKDKERIKKMGKENLKKKERKGEKKTKRDKKVEHVKSGEEKEDDAKKTKERNGKKKRSENSNKRM